MASRAGRPRADGTPLSAERIVRAAVALVDREGMDALTMRALASGLRVDPMAIYHHVSNKRALVHLMVTVVFGELVVALEPARVGNGPLRVRVFAEAYLRVATSHQALTLHLIRDADAATGEVAVVTEILRDALAACGLEGADVPRAGDVVVDWLNGVALAGAAAAVDVGFGADLLLAGIAQLASRRGP